VVRDLQAWITGKTEYGPAAHCSYAIRFFSILGWSGRAEASTGRVLRVATAETNSAFAWPRREIAGRLRIVIVLTAVMWVVGWRLGLCSA